MEKSDHAKCTDIITKCTDIITKCDGKDEEVSEYLFENIVQEFITLQSWISSECVHEREIITIIKKHQKGDNKKSLVNLGKMILQIKKASESALAGVLSKNNLNSKIPSENIQKISEEIIKLSETVTELYCIRDQLIDLVHEIKK